MFLRKNMGFLAACMLFFGCNKKEKQLVSIMALQQMNELATVEYVVTKIIRAEDNKTGYKIGDRKILMNCKATLTAGINLSAITKEQVQIDEKSIRISLPHAQLIAINIKPEDISVAYQAIDLLRTPFSANERNALATQAENQLKGSVTELGILQTAEANATLVVSNFLKRLGYEKISINFDQSKSFNN